MFLLLDQTVPFLETKELDFFMRLRCAEGRETEFKD